VAHTVPAVLASRIVWFDAFVSNVDRTPRNTNMLMWHRAPWLIDHGSTLYFHHAPGWEIDPARAKDPFPAIKNHVLLRLASRIPEEDEQMAALLTAEAIDEVLSMVPDDWIAADPARAADTRGAYRRYFLQRLAPPRAFVTEAAGAR
jgi:hypothetical protein